MDKKQQVIISMTSFPAAIGYAEMAIQSLLRGSVQPDKIVLYLTQSQFEGCSLPESLVKLQKQNAIFEIRHYDRDIRSYTKLIPALRDFPEDIIVTVDDDVYYHRDMLRELLALHAKLPDAIVAQRARRIKKNLPYRKWTKFHWYDFLFKRLHVSHSTLQTGVGGVLYPPHSLNPAMLAPDLFMSIAPTADDIWFWAAAARQGVPVVPVPFGRTHPREIGKPRSLSLKWINYEGGDDKNAVALKKIIEKYPDVENCLV